MPIYEYRCQGCNEVFEVFQGHRDPPPAKHRCGATEVTRVLSRTSFRLVGDGWYQSDYGSRPQPPASEGSGDKSDKNDKNAKADKASDAGQPSDGKATASAAAAPTSAPAAGSQGARAAAPQAASPSAKGTDRTG